MPIQSSAKQSKNICDNKVGCGLVETLPLFTLLKVANVCHMYFQQNWHIQYLPPETTHMHMHAKLNWGIAFWLCVKMLQLTTNSCVTYRYQLALAQPHTIHTPQNTFSLTCLSFWAVKNLFTEIPPYFWEILKRHHQHQCCAASLITSQSIEFYANESMKLGTSRIEATHRQRTGSGTG